MAHPDSFSARSDLRVGDRSFEIFRLDALAARWGVDHDEHGTRVWFEVDRRRRRFQRS